MLLTAKQLTVELCSLLDPANATAAVESYQEMQQRFCWRLAADRVGRWILQNHSAGEYRQ